MRHSPLPPPFFPDGVSTRRVSSFAPIESGKRHVTAQGPRCRVRDAVAPHRHRSARSRDSRCGLRRLPRAAGCAADHDHEPAARLQPPRRADDLFHRSRHPHGRSGVRRHRAAEQRHPAPVDRSAVVGRARPGIPSGRYLVWSDIPNNRQLRWLEDDGHVSVFRMPSNNSQRQHLRLPGPPALLRAPDAAGGALRARRLDHGPGRQLRGQAAQLAERRRAASRRQLLVHRSALWRPALRGRARRRRRADATPQGG